MGRLKLKNFSLLILASFNCYFLMVDRTFSTSQKIPAGTLECERLILRDANHKTRAGLFVAEGDRTVMQLYDKNEVVRSQVWASNESGGGVSLYDTKGQERVGISSLEDGTSWIRILDSLGEDILTIGTGDPNDINNPRGLRITARDEAGNSRLEINMMSDGKSGLLVKDSNENLKAFIGTDDSQNGLTLVSDSSNKSSIYIGTIDRDAAGDAAEGLGITAWKVGDSLRFVLNPFNEENPNMKIFNREQKVLFRAVGPESESFSQSNRPYFVSIPDETAGVNHLKVKGR